MNIIHDSCKFGIFGISGVDGMNGIVKILDIFSVHFEEGRKFDNDIPDPLIGRFLFWTVPQCHTVSQLEKNKILSIEIISGNSMSSIIHFIKMTRYETMHDTLKGFEDHTKSAIVYDNSQSYIFCE